MAEYLRVPIEEITALRLRSVDQAAEVAAMREMLHDVVKERDMWRSRAEAAEESLRQCADNGVLPW